MSKFSHRQKTEQLADPIIWVFTFRKLLLLPQLPKIVSLNTIFWRFFFQDPKFVANSVFVEKPACSHSLFTLPVSLSSLYLSLSLSLYATCLSLSLSLFTLPISLSLPVLLFLSIPSPLLTTHLFLPVSLSFSLSLSLFPSLPYYPLFNLWRHAVAAVSPHLHHPQRRIHRRRHRHLTTSSKSCSSRLVLWRHRTCHSFVHSFIHPFKVSSVIKCPIESSLLE